MDVYFKSLVDELRKEGEGRGVLTEALAHSWDQGLRLRIQGPGWFPDGLCHLLGFPGSRDTGSFWFINVVPPLALPPGFALAFHHTLSKKGTLPHTSFMAIPAAPHPIPLPTGSCTQAGWSMFLSF